ncbi:MAG TPA: cytochrome P450 [Actinoplanes sp.]|jgi:cytochrome P450|nr:cytochrome P450 [Actinoplanes sp.]
MSDVQQRANPFLPENRARLYPLLAELRADAPVCRITQANGLTVWVVTRQAEARAALTDRRLVKNPAHAADALDRAGVFLGRGEIRQAASLLTSDPPVHTRLRGLVSEAFTRQRVEALRPRIREIADELLDRVTDRPSFDLIQEYAYPLPALVISQLLGVATGDQEMFRGWVAAMLTPAGVPDANDIREAASLAMRQYLAELVARKRADLERGRADASADLTTALVVARDAGDRLAEPEIIRLLEEILIGGYETTAHMIGNGAAALLSDRGQLRLLQEQPVLLESAIDEFIRYDGSVTRATLRIALEDVEIGGVPIPAGSPVSVVLAAANRDPEVFDDPDRLDITRQPNPHLGLGHGVHYCLGAPLARVEGEIAFDRLLRRLPGLALGCDPADLRWRPLGIQRGLAALPVRTGR